MPTDIKFQVIFKNIHINALKIAGSMYKGLTN